MVQRSHRAVRAEVMGLDVRRIASSLIKWLSELMN
jgi:hypothetical protein